MVLPAWTPNVVRHELRLLYLRLKYPGRAIGSSQIDLTVRLGTPCRIEMGVELGAGVQIGDFSYVNQGTAIACGSVGNFCSIGYYCQIGMHEHPIDYLSTSPYLYGKESLFQRQPLWDDRAAPPTIGHDVWVGSHAVIMQGITIGHGSVIGAGSIVTKDVAPYMVVAGVPARVIRPRFAAEAAAQLLASAWWDWPVERLRALEPVYAAGARWHEVMAKMAGEGDP